MFEEREVRSAKFADLFICSFLYAHLSTNLSSLSSFSRFFGDFGNLRVGSKDFSQFLLEFQREQGRQAWQRASNGGYVSSTTFIELLHNTCGWRLPPAIRERLETLYCKDSLSAAQHTAIEAAKIEKLKKSNSEDAALNVSQAILKVIEEKQGYRRIFNYSQFLAAQEVSERDFYVVR